MTDVFGDLKPVLELFLAWPARQASHWNAAQLRDCSQRHRFARALGLVHHRDCDSRSQRGGGVRI